MYFVILLNRPVEYRFRGMVKIFGDTWIFDPFFARTNALHFEHFYLFEPLRTSSVQKFSRSASSTEPIFPVTSSGMSSVL